MNSSGLRAAARALVYLFLSLGGVTATLAAYNPAQNLDPASSGIQLDSSFQSDAWLVYTYEIDVDGSVVDAAIRHSNGVLEVEQAVLRQVSAMKFQPATRNGQPVRATAGPMTYTWILDKRREMSPRFSDMYRQAWAHYAEGDYAAASGIAVLLKSYPGRNALEEVKSRLLAASLGNRQGDEAGELRNLLRIVEFQKLAMDNDFNNVYVGNDQYLKILSRIQSLQINRNLLADASKTSQLMASLASGSGDANNAAARYREAELALQGVEDVPVNGELVAPYTGGPGAWKAGLFRQEFALSDIRGRVGAVFLVCGGSEKQLPYPSSVPWKVPPGWRDCMVDVTGDAGTQLILHQYAR